MKTTISTSVLALVLLLSACGSDGPGSANDETTPSQATETTRLWIKPDLVDCIGEAEQTCMQIAESVDGEYLFFYDQIVGFSFEEGTSYVIDVTIDEVADPPADGSSLTYTLVEIVEQE